MRAPQCSTGQLVRVLASRTCEVDGKTYEVGELMPYECNACGALSWPDQELERGREMLEVLLKQMGTRSFPLSRDTVGPR